MLILFDDEGKKRKRVARRGRAREKKVGKVGRFQRLCFPSAEAPAMLKMGGKEKKTRKKEDEDDRRLKVLEK